MMKYILLPLFLLLLAGCSSKTNKELPPAQLVSFDAETTLDKQWSRSIGNGQGDGYSILTPAVQDDVVYAAAVNGEIQAIQSSSNDTLWKRNLGVAISGGVSVHHDTLVLSTLKGQVIALSASTGEKLWNAFAGSEVISAAALNNDLVVVQTVDDRLLALDINTGAQRWSYVGSPAILTLRGTGSPLIAGNMVLAGLSNGKVVAVDIQTGTLVWEAEVATPHGRDEIERMVDIDGGLFVSQGVVYVAAYQGKVAGLELATGQLLWEKDASSYMGVSHGLDAVYVSEADGTVEAIDVKTGASLWKNDALARRQLSAPTVFDGYVVVGDFEGYLHVLSQADGRFVGRKRIDSAGLRAPALVVDDTLYVYGNSGKLVALTLE